MPRDVPERSTGPGAKRGVSRMAAIAAASFGLYLLFVGSVGVAEAALGIVCAGLATTWARRMHEDPATAMSLRSSMLRQPLTALGRLPGKAVRIGRDLIRAAVGGRAAGIVEVHPAAAFVVHPLSDPRAQGERALAVLAASLAPDSYVLRLDAGRAEITTHAFGPPAPAGVAT